MSATVCWSNALVLIAVLLISAASVEPSGRSNNAFGAWLIRRLAVRIKLHGQINELHIVCMYVRMSLNAAKPVAICILVALLELVITVIYN